MKCVCVCVWTTCPKSLETERKREKRNRNKLAARKSIRRATWANVRQSVLVSVSFKPCCCCCCWCWCDCVRRSPRPRRRLSVAINKKACARVCQSRRPTGHRDAACVFIPRRRQSRAPSDAAKEPGWRHVDHFTYLLKLLLKLLEVQPELAVLQLVNNYFCCQVSPIIASSTKFEGRCSYFEYILRSCFTATVSAL